jgi:hypothetical protein
MLTHKQAAVEAVTALLHNAPLLFSVGAITVIPGLAMVLGHNVWSGGAMPVIVTLVGWTTLIKGALLLFLSPETESRLFLDALHYQQLFYLYACIALLLGVYLTVAARSQQRANQ